LKHGPGVNGCCPGSWGAFSASLKCLSTRYSIQNMIFFCVGMHFFHRTVQTVRTELVKCVYIVYLTRTRQILQASQEAGKSRSALFSFQRARGKREAGRRERGARSREREARSRERGAGGSEIPQFLNPPIYSNPVQIIPCGDLAVPNGNRNGNRNGKKNRERRAEKITPFGASSQSALTRNRARTGHS
jgi:hypothetical protein